jgi:hypothetical protein
MATSMGKPPPPVFSAATAGVIQRLGQEMAEISDPQIASHLRIGQVTAVDSGTVTATVAYGAGANLVAIAGHHWLDGHQPAVNDYVQVLSQDGDNWIVGKIATTMAAGGTSAATADVTTGQNTTSTSYTDLATDGPSVTLDMDAGQKAMVFLRSEIFNTFLDTTAWASFAVSGAETLAASDSNAIRHRIQSSNDTSRYSSHTLYTAAVTGSHTFKMRYRVDSAADTTFQNRRITVHVLPV